MKLLLKSLYILLHLSVTVNLGFSSYSGVVPRVNGTATSVHAAIGDAKPPAAGPNVLYVRTVDAVGNVSEPTRYFFYVTPRDQADKPGDFTGDQFPDVVVVTDEGNLAL